MKILSVDTVNYWYLTTAHVILRCDEGTHGRYDQLCMYTVLFKAPHTIATPIDLTLSVKFQCRGEKRN